MGNAPHQQQKYTPVTHRLFIGLRPPGAIRDVLSATMDGVENARWQSDEQLHITLRFIGEVTAPVADDIALAMSRVDAVRIECALSGVGQFDHRGRPHSIWAGLTPHEGLAHLHRKLDRLLVTLGLSPEGRAFLPHITLARLNGSSGPVAPWLAAHATLSSAPFACDALLLFESHLGRSGATYEAVARQPLRSISPA